MSDGKSIITDKRIVFQTPPTIVNPRVGWRTRDFEELIQAHGYDAYIDKALRCPCGDKSNGQALSTCRNCLGRGWIFVDRTETRLIAQHMDSKKRYENWSEVNRGTASITTKASDKLGFMDRIILFQLEEFYSEIIRPIFFENKLIAYPVYEPLEVTNMYLFSEDNEPLVSLTKDDYIIDKNRIEFDPSILEFISINDPNIQDFTQIPVSISIRYSHYPVYHIIEVNRELMRVREGKLCNVDDKNLVQMPINAMARKAHYIFDAQKYGEEAIDNSQ
jgi:hypothetical protein